jgi:hypothetical protein
MYDCGNASVSVDLNVGGQCIFGVGVLGTVGLTATGKHGCPFRLGHCDWKKQVQRNVASELQIDAYSKCQHENISEKISIKSEYH